MTFRTRSGAGIDSIHAMIPVIGNLIETSLFYCSDFVCQFSVIQDILYQISVISEVNFHIVCSKVKR